MVLLNDRRKFSKVHDLTIFENDNQTAIIRIFHSPKQKLKPLFQFDCKFVTSVSHGSRAMISLSLGQTGPKSYRLSIHNPDNFSNVYKGGKKRKKWFALSSQKTVGIVVYKRRLSPLEKERERNTRQPVVYIASILIKSQIFRSEYVSWRGHQTRISVTMTCNH